MIKDKLIPLWFTLGLIIVIFTFTRESSPSIMGFVDGLAKIEFNASFSNYINKFVDLYNSLGLFDLFNDAFTLPTVNSFVDNFKYVTWYIDLSFSVWEFIINVIFSLGKFFKLLFDLLFDFLGDVIKILQFLSSYLMNSVD